MAVETSARAISSSTMDASTSPYPSPPCSSGTVTRSRSAAASAPAASRGGSPDSSPCAARGATSRSASPRASCRSADWSSVSANGSVPCAPAIRPAHSASGLRRTMRVNRSVTTGSPASSRQSISRT